MGKRIGLLTAGSDCPGLNAAIRGIGKSALNTYGDNLIGFQDGFEGLVQNRFLNIETSMLSNILTAGGTFLGTSRILPQTFPVNNSAKDLTSKAILAYKKNSLDALICIGGKETLETLKILTKHNLNVVLIPKAIDNDIPGTDLCIGFSTAMGIATEMIDRLHSTAHSNHRIIIVELAGQHAGWLALGAGMAGGADVILIPEIPYDLEKIAAAIQKRKEAGKHFSLVVVAEGAISKEHVAFYENTQAINAKNRKGNEKIKVSERLKQMEKRSSQGNTLLLANRLEIMTGLETRPTIPGYLLRGGTPSAADRLLANMMGTAAVDFIHQDKSQFLTNQCNQTPCALPLSECKTEHNPISLDHPWIHGARQVNTNMGD